MNQHFVPRAYLKNFSDKQGKDFFIDAYDKKSGKQFRTNIKRICSEIDLYTLEDGNTVARDIFAIEKIYANSLEPLYVRSYNLLTNNDINHISDLQRVELLISIFQFHFRNPKILKRALSHHKRAILQIYNDAKIKGLKGITYLDEDFSFREYDDASIVSYFEKKVTKEYKEKHLIGLQEIGSFHEYAKFEVSIIKEDSEFFTSDTPLILHDRIANNENPFLKSKEFFISINKKVALRIFHDNRVSLNSIRRHWIPNGSVAFINDEIYKQSSRFIFSSSEKLKEHHDIYEMLQDNSLKFKMDAMRQILNITGEHEHPKMRKIFRYYLNLYEQNGMLTEKEESEMSQQIHSQTATFMNKITGS